MISMDDYEYDQDITNRQPYDISVLIKEILYLRKLIKDCEQFLSNRGITVESRVEVAHTAITMHLSRKENSYLENCINYYTGDD